MQKKGQGIGAFTLQKQHQSGQGHLREYVIMQVGSSKASTSMERVVQFTFKYNNTSGH